jgi:iron complex transport system permease protein
VLVGIGVGFFAYAGVDFLMTRSDIFEAAAAQSWLNGSLNARLWSHVWIVVAGAAVLMPLALLLQPGLDRVELGDDLAAALGVRVNATRLATGLVGVLLAALAVASAGPLPFVALVAAPIARRVANGSGVMLVTAALVGAVVVTAGDLGGRLAFAPTQLPAGVFTAVLGAPYLLWLLATQIRKGTM